MKKIDLELIEKEDNLIENEKRLQEVKQDRLKHRIEEMNIEKVKDTSQEEINTGNHIIYPFEVKTNEKIEIINSKKDFMYSKYWNKLKFEYIRVNRILGKKATICECCGKEFKIEFIQLHHLTYKNIGNEKFNELIRLCFNCHGKIHGKEEITQNENRSQKDIKRKNKLTLSSLILIGKYKNDKLTLKALIEKDKKYVQWLVNNDVIRVNDKIKELIF